MNLIATALVCAAGLLGTGCRETAAPPPGAPSVQDTLLLLRDVNVVPVQDPGTLARQTIVIRRGIVQTIGPAASTPVPAGATVIEGNGRTVIPGLIDAHVHMNRADAPAYVAAGILTVRNMWGYSTLGVLIGDIGAGRVSGPEIVSLSPGLDGTPASWPETQHVLDPALADSVVAAQIAAGYRVMKVYQRLAAPVFTAIANAAHARGVRIAGHVPTAVTIQEALAAGMQTIEHLGGYDRAVSATRRQGTWAWLDANPAQYDVLAAATAAAGVWNSPTMAIYAALADRQHAAPERDRIIAERRAFVGALRRAGARVVAGTDAGIEIVPPGTSLLTELRELEAAGFSRAEALAAATSGPAELLGRPDLGRIATGLPARLVMLDGNPLDDLGALGRVVGVVQGDRWRAANDRAPGTGPRR